MGGPTLATLQVLEGYGRRLSSGRNIWTPDFLALSGFSDDGIEAYSRGRPTPIICLDGLDLYDTLSRNLRLDEVIASKVRRAAETGSPFARVRELFPQ